MQRTRHISQDRPEENQVKDARLNYISIPIELVACPFFTPKDKEVIMEIVNLSDKYFSSGGCSRSNKNLAFRHRITPEKVSNIITMANRLGFVTSREDETKSYSTKIGSTMFSTERRITMKIPVEWQAMGDLYNEAFIREKLDFVEIFEAIEKELKQIKNIDIDQELVKEIIFKRFSGHKRKNLGVEKENPPAIYKGNSLSKDKENKGRKDSSAFLNPDRVYSLWNQITKNSGLPYILKLSQSRRNKIISRYDDLPKLSDWKKLFNKILDSPFLLGENDRGWRADFDWVISNDKNYLKILEGKYTSKPKSKKIIGRAKGDDDKYSQKNVIVYNTDKQ